MKSLGSIVSSAARNVQDAMPVHPEIVDDKAVNEPGERTLLDKWKFVMAVAGDDELAKLGRAPLAATIIILDSYDRRTGLYTCAFGQIAERARINRSTAIRAVEALVPRWFLRLSGGRTKRKAKRPNRYIPQWSRAGLA